jgi:hypothetical protein
MENTKTKLLLEVPTSVMKAYLEMLDVKSAAMLIASCRQYANERIFVKNKKIASMNKLLEDFIELAASTYKYMNSYATRYAMMSDILRKLIYTSVTINHHTDESTMHGPQLCYQEYEDICTEFCQEEELDLTWHKLNSLLENAQFEFRGFNIIGISPAERELLDTIKERLFARYFDSDMTVNIYTQMGDFYMDINVSNNEITVDIYRSHEDTWQYLGEAAVSEEDLEGSNIIISNGTFVWNIEHESQCKYITSILEKYYPHNNILVGGDQATMSFYNSHTEDCFVLREVINQHKLLKGYESNVSYTANQFKFAYTYP